MYSCMLTALSFPLLREDKGCENTLQSLINMARADGHTKIVCEVNLDPPNPGSDAFHDQMGFVEVGRAHLKEREKTVRYLCKSI